MPITPDDDTGGGGSGGGLPGGALPTGAQMIRIRGRFLGEKNASGTARIEFTITPSAISTLPLTFHQLLVEAEMVGR